MTKSYESPYKCQFAVILSLADLARACHLRKEDAAFALAELGFLQHRRARSVSNDVRKHLDPGEWKDMEVVVSREMVEELWVKWRVREKGVLSGASCYDLA